MNVGLPSRKNWRKNADEAKGKTVLMMLLSFSLSLPLSRRIVPEILRDEERLIQRDKRFEYPSYKKIDSFNNEQGKNQRH